MSQPSEIFDIHYQNYIEQLKKLDFTRVGPAAGAEPIENDQRLSLPFFNKPYGISAGEIKGPDGNRAGYDTCIILSRYLIMASQRLDNTTNEKIPGGNWTGFRDLKESGPLTVYFRDNVETVISESLAGNLPHSVERLAFLNGCTPGIEVQYDLALEIQALPRIPMLLLFNDGEEGFAPSCSVLFESRVETYLDAECIAMLGYRLGTLIKQNMAK